MIADPALPAIAPDVRVRTWSIYGLRLATAHPFANRLLETDGPPDLHLCYVDAAPLPEGWEAGAPAYASSARIDEHRSVLSLHLLPECTVLRFTEVVEFFLWPDRIDCLVLDDAYERMVELRLLAYALPFWLEVRGVSMLHAACVVIDGHAVGLLSSNKGGKTSLASSLMRLGHPLLSDDILPLERTDSGVVARPGFPQMRMWPEEARRFVGDPDSLELAHPHFDKRRVPVGQGGFGSFCSDPRPLACLYLLRRGAAAGVSFSPLPTGRAIVQLVAHSSLAGVAEGAGLEVPRFHRFAELTRAVPVRTLDFPDRFERLGAVADAVVADVAALVRERSRGG